MFDFGVNPSSNKLAKFFQTKKSAFSKCVFALMIIIAFLVISSIKFSIDKTDIKQIQQSEAIEPALEEEDVANLIKKDHKVLTLEEAEKKFIEYSKRFISGEQVKSLFRHVVFIECDYDGDLREATGVVMRGFNHEDPNEWYVYTNAHITGTDKKKVRMCRVRVPLIAGADPLDTESVDIFEATVVYVAPGYPDVDFTVLRLIDANGIPEASLERCLDENNIIGDSVMILGYPNRKLTITSGYITNIFASINNGSVAETSASAYPGHSGGMGLNLSKNCSIGIVTWSEGETSFGEIQTWGMLYQ
jgi:hypothetical protein